MVIVTGKKQSKKKTSLSEKVVLITGASSGIGESIAHKFYKAGCNVVLAARRTTELERVKREMLESNPDVVTYPPMVLPLDLNDFDALPGIVAQVLAHYGRIDILVNNGGISHRGSVVDTKAEVDVKIMRVNYFGAVAMIKAVLPSMIRAKRGHIVSVNSLQGRISFAYRSAYGASKCAMQGFLDCLRAEVRQHNIFVSVLSPGYVNTALSKNALTADGRTYGETDPSTSSGYAPSKVADAAATAVLRRHNEMLIAPITANYALFLRYAFPSILFWIMKENGKKKSKL